MIKYIESLSPGPVLGVVGPTKSLYPLVVLAAELPQTALRALRLIDSHFY